MVIHVARPISIAKFPILSWEYTYRPGDMDSYIIDNLLAGLTARVFNFCHANLNVSTMSASSLATLIWYLARSE